MLVQMAQYIAHLMADKTGRVTNLIFWYGDLISSIYPAIRPTFGMLHMQSVLAAIRVERGLRNLGLIIFSFAILFLQMKIMVGY